MTDWSTSLRRSRATPRPLPVLRPEQVAENKRVNAEKDETIDILVNRAEVLVKKLDKTVGSMQHKLQQNGG